MKVNALSSVFDALQGVAQGCSAKRTALAKAGMRRSAWRKGLHLTSGILALLSGAGISAIIAKLTTSMAVQVFSAVIAFASGLITIVMAGYFDEKETAKIYDGAGKFLALRDQAMLVLSRPDVTEKQAYSALEKIRADYAKHSQEFDRFIPQIAARSSHFTSGHYGSIATEH